MSLSTTKTVKVVFDADGNPLQKTVTEVEKSVKKMSDSVDSASNTAGKAGGVFGKFGTDVQKGFQMAFGLGTVQLVTSAINAVQQGLSYVTQTGVQFEASMSNVQAITGATGAEMDNMTSFAREMGATTVKSATEASEAMAYMGMAGWDTQEIMAGLPAVLNLSIASATEFGRVSDIVTDNLTAFGMTADDASYYSDNLAYAMTHANVNMENLGETLKYIAPVASGAGVSMEETVAMTMMLGDAGIKGSQAGTTLRTVLLNLTGANAKATATLKELGVSIYDSNGNMRSMADILTDLSGKLIDANGNVDTTTANLLVGKTAVSGFTAMLQQGGGVLADYSQGLASSTGEAQRMADTMSNNVQGSWMSFKSAVEESALSLYEKVQPALKTTLDVMTDLLRGTQDVGTKAQENFSVFGVSVSEGTAQALAGTEEIINSMNNTMFHMDKLGKETTPTMVNDMLMGYQQLKDGVVDKVTTMHDEELAGYEEFATTRLGFTEEQNQLLHKKMDEYRNTHLEKANDLYAEAKAILDQYNGDTTTMTSEHYAELQRIQEEFKNLSIETLTSQIDDQKNLMDGYASSSFKITEENAQDILNTAMQHKTDMINTARERTDEELKKIGELRQIGVITDEAYGEHVASAQKRFDEAEQNANDYCQAIVDNVEEQLGQNVVKVANDGMLELNKGLIKGRKDAQLEFDENPVEVQLDKKNPIEESRKLWSSVFNILSKPFKMKASMSVTKTVTTVQKEQKAYSSQGIVNALQNRAIGVPSGYNAPRNSIGNQTINFNGNYGFNSRSDIDYFMKQTARKIERYY